MQLIYWEILRWTTDWINKVYTAQNTIDSVVTLYIWVTPYTNFTINWRIITLNEAIPSWWDNPTLDYYFTDNVTTIVNADYTIANALTDILWLVKISNWNNAYAQSDAIQFLNEWYFTELNKTHSIKELWTYSFTKWATYKYWDFYRWDIIPIAWVIDNYTPRVWKVIVWWFVVDFNTRTDSNISLTNWLTMEWKQWDLIIVWYKIPDAIKEITECVVNWTPYNRVKIEDFNNWEEYWIYTIYNWYLFISNSDSLDVVIYYTRKNKLFTLTTDIIDIEPVYRRLPSLYAASKMMQITEDTRWQNIENEWIKLKRKYTAYNSRHSKRYTWMNYFKWPLSWL